MFNSTRVSGQIISNRLLILNWAIREIQLNLVLVCCCFQWEIGRWKWHICHPIRFAIGKWVAGIFPIPFRRRWILFRPCRGIRLNSARPFHWIIKELRISLGILKWFCFRTWNRVAKWVRRGMDRTVHSAIVSRRAKRWPTLQNALSLFHDPGSTTQHHHVGNFHE